MTARVALVTGGTGGIGSAIVKRLASMGHKVATNYRDEARANTMSCSSRVTWATPNRPQRW
jgi:acetoacetyl-CoA reductase